jgi:CheY-like chemotaxis protein
MSPGNDAVKPLLLLVDGNLIERTGLAAILERAGYAVLPAASTIQGLELLARHTPDLILLDLLLPGGASGDFLRVKAERPDNIPVVGLLRDAVPVPRLPAGVRVDDTLTKPLRAAEVLGGVRRHATPRPAALAGV